MEMLKRFWNGEEGQGMVEYGLIIALIAVVVVVALGPLGTEIANLFNGVKGDLAKTS